MLSDAQWHPVAAAQTLRAGHGVLASRLLGQPLALWRSADGRPQAWGDRCPHRGVRLSLGRVVGNHLACAYHGWEYAAGNGRCVAIPAMPREPVPGRVCARVYPVREVQSMVWVALQPPAAPDTTGSSCDSLAPPDADAPQPERLIRALAVHAPLSRVQAVLVQEGFASTGPSRWDGSLVGSAVCAFAQQADTDLVLLHCLHARPGSEAASPAVFAQLRRLRSAMEHKAS